MCYWMLSTINSMSSLSKEGSFFSDPVHASSWEGQAVVAEACWMTAHILMDGEQGSRPEAGLHPQGMPQGPVSSRCVPCTWESPALALCLPSKTAPHKQCQVLLPAQDASKCLFTRTELTLGETWLFRRNLVSVLRKHSPMGPVECGGSE